ncbi:MAG TPA: CvpA family protein [Casimicrobiaceae bacterium]|nr:CvpA family protein [Casimicrobiaceae bacterium]
MLDLAIVVIVVVSAFLAFARGIVRSLIGLLAWVVGFVAAIAFAPSALAFFTGAQDSVIGYAIAFVVIFILVLVAGALIAWPLRTLIHKAGLGFVDRGLGLTFGFARGLVVVLALVVVGSIAGMTERDWWQNSWLVAPFERTAVSLKPWLPPAWADRLRFRDGPASGVLKA